MELIEILLGPVWAMVVGFVWYSPSYGFGKQWMKMTGLSVKSMEASQKGMSRIFGLTFVLNIAMMYILKLFLGGNSDLLSNLITTFFFGVAFTLIPFTVNNLFVRKPFALSLLDGLYHVVVLLGMAVVIHFV